MELTAHPPINIKFLFFLLGAITHKIKDTGHGIALIHVTKKGMENYKIPLPPLKIQQQIVELLDRAQALIAKRQEQISLMDQLIQSLFYTMFGDPDKDKTILTVELNSVCKKITDGTHQSPKWSKGGVPFLFVSNIKNRKIDFKTSKFISNEEYIKLT